MRRGAAAGLHVELRKFGLFSARRQTAAGVGKGEAGRASRTNRQSGVVSLHFMTLTMHGCSSILALNTLQFAGQKQRCLWLGNAVANEFRHECAPATAALPCQSVGRVVRPPSEDQSERGSAQVAPAGVTSTMPSASCSTSLKASRMTPSILAL